MCVCVWCMWLLPVYQYSACNAMHICFLNVTQPVPDNIFIVAACNPHRGNSVVHLEKKQPSKSWVRGSYNVHRLHPTIRYLKWDYGALDSQQEEQYIKAKMAMMGHDDNK